MSKKTMLLILAVACGLMLAVPTIASALVPWHKDGGSTALAIHGGAATLGTGNGETITCTSASGTGAYENSTTGLITLTFHGCLTTVLGATVNCQSGATTGTIETTALPFHNAMITATKPGILVTPNASGSFAHFKCSFVSITVTGNGVIGEVENGCGATTKELSINFGSPAHGTQEFTTILGTSTEYNLLRGVANAAQKGTATFTSAEAGTVNCTF